MDAPGSFVYEVRTRWPPLAWVARCRTGDSRVEVCLGSDVERRSTWFCEATWDGSFEEGGFDRTDAIFGSGGRIRSDGVRFVSSGAVCDRLHWLRTEDGLRVSNSLPALLAEAGAEVDPTYDGWVQDFQSVKRGLDAYVRTIATSVGDLHLTYHRNLVWDGREALESDKPRPGRDLGTYAAYRGFLGRTVRSLAANLAAPERCRPFRMLGTISSGYDSPAVAALCRESGLREAITFGQARLGLPDSGEEIGRALGLEVHVYDRQAWRSFPMPEPPFLAGSASGGEVYVRAVEARLRGRALMTGMWGDRVWGWKYRDRTGPLETFGPQGGLSLTEYRLHAGFLHCPLPALAALRRDELVELTLSDEMAPWNEVGAVYDRPIPRRICEEAGVPRDLLGRGKRYGALIMAEPEIFWTLPSLPDFLAWLRERRGRWLRRGRVPPELLAGLLRPAQAACLRTLAALETTGFRRERWKLTKRLDYLCRREYLFLFTFPWALERIAASYRSPAPGRATLDP